MNELIATVVCAVLSSVTAAFWCCTAAAPALVGGFASFGGAR